MFLSWLPLSATTMDVQSFKNFHLLSFGSRCSAASSSRSLSSAPADSSFKKEYYYQTSKYLSYLCSSLSAAWAAFSVFWLYRFIRLMKSAILFKEISPPNNWETSIFMLSVDITAGQKSYWTSHHWICLYHSVDWRLTTQSSLLVYWWTADKL